MILKYDQYETMVNNGYLLKDCCLEKKFTKGKIKIEFEIEGFRTLLMGGGNMKKELYNEFFKEFSTAMSKALEFEKLII